MRWTFKQNKLQADCKSWFAISAGCLKRANVHSYHCCCLGCIDQQEPRMSLRSRIRKSRLLFRAVHVNLVMRSRYYEQGRY